jgi:hypothetical protein
MSRVEVVRTPDNVTTVSRGEQPLGYINRLENRSDPAEKYRAVRLNGNIGIFSTAAEAVEYLLVGSP